MSRTYRKDIDLLKGFAIIAIILYHLGLLKSGYLGVDAFFVINGFFIMPKVVNKVGNDGFRFFPFIGKRIMRLLPLMIIVAAATLVVGYWGMLPDDYENLSESIIATCFFSNNILADITTRNYWNVVNEYKPLMHTWYIGILFEFYLVMPLIAIAIRRVSKRRPFDYNNLVIVTFFVLSFLSLLWFLNPKVGVGDKFYLLPSRFFELSLGGLAGMLIANNRNGKLYHHDFISCLILVLFLLTMMMGGWYNYEAYHNIVLIIVVMLTIVYVISDNVLNRQVLRLCRIKVFCIMGAMSYSIYLWHQPILAFYRYFVSESMSIHFLLFFFGVVTVVSYISYMFVEKKMQLRLNTKSVVIAGFVIVNSLAFSIYMHAGVVRDVPELDISKDNVHRNMFAEYNDRIYRYDKDFPSENGKLNVLVVGNSFARDWCNILLESYMADKINLSYIYKLNEEYVNRIKQSDYIFIHERKSLVPQYLWDNVKCDAIVWGLGAKRFGKSNGVIYKNRNKDWYYNQTAIVTPEVVSLNKVLEAEWKEMYLDMLQVVVQNDGSVRVFTDDHKLISQDCRHLTVGGAKYYARNFNFEKIFKRVQ